MQSFFDRVRQLSIVRLIARIVTRIAYLPHVLRPRERATVSVLLVVVILSAVILFFGRTGTKPAYGGTFTEGFVGQPRFINPLLASSDADRSISQLVYSGLTTLDSKGNVIPDLADHWVVSDDGKTYTFFLRNDVLWHDGQKMTAADVIYTVNLIKDPSTNSAYLGTWKDITAESRGDTTVVFHLKDPLPTFPWYSSVGIVPAHIDKRNLSTSFVGTGPYKYSKVRMQGGLIQSLVLVRNSHWYGAHLPYLDAVECWFYSDNNALKAAVGGQKILAALGNFDDRRVVSYPIELSQGTTAFLNSQSTVLTDIAVRKKIITASASFNPPITLSVVADTRIANDGGLQHLLQDWQKRGISAKVTEQGLDTIQKVTLPQHAYDVIVVPIERGPQVDPYVYWHSSQADGAGLNFARLKNNDLDKLVSDQKRSTNISDRAMLLQKIDQLVNDQAVTILLSQDSATYSVSKTVHLQLINQNSSPSDRFTLFDQWYIKTRR